MKKWMTLGLCVIFIAGLLSGCAEALKPEAGPIAREMMTALEHGDAETAQSLIHPDGEVSAESIAAMIDYIDGRGTTELKQISLHVSNSAGINGRKQEEGTLRATLSDGSVLTVTYTYLKNKAGTGFASFNISIG